MGTVRQDEEFGGDVNSYRRLISPPAPPVEGIVKTFNLLGSLSAMGPNGIAAAFLTANTTAAVTITGVAGSSALTLLAAAGSNALAVTGPVNVTGPVALLGAGSTLALGGAVTATAGISANAFTYTGSASANLPSPDLGESAVTNNKILLDLQRRFRLLLKAVAIQMGMGFVAVGGTYLIPEAAIAMGTT